MTTQRETKLSYTEQQAVIRALHSVDEPDLATRLDRCMAAHRSGQNGSGRRFSCQSAACMWCRPATSHGWWTGMCDWAEAASSLAILPIASSVSLPNAARHLRRAMRDVRDRVARSRNPWRQVRFAGIIGGDRRAMVVGNRSMRLLPHRLSIPCQSSSDEAAGMALPSRDENTFSIGDYVPQTRSNSSADLGLQPDTFRESNQVHSDMETARPSPPEGAGFHRLASGLAALRS